MNDVVTISPPEFKLSFFAPRKVKRAFYNWERLGGIGGMVLVDPAKSYVLKITGCLSSARLLDRQLTDPISSLPTVIERFGKIGTGKYPDGYSFPIYAFAIDWLTSGDPEICCHLAETIFRCRQTVFVESGEHSIGEPALSIKTLEKFADLAPVDLREGLERIKETILETKGRLDLNVPANWMMRGTQLVMSDPLITPRSW